ncbi:hypothetical protein F0562_013743 [Nyssa sinensis]|uniref:Uncharacterized protein n=1 Tax=Nyssa sinensis TaxID=561372 RepID=A0A5J4ZQQ1_9ASTE|nr:hypothetical protein F0562_013743 [Nyssa sinensis]
MAFPSAFGERLEQMEQTRKQRLSILQAEKELQINKSQVLASKLTNIRAMEQRCLKLDHKMSSQHFIISSLKSEINRLDSKYLDNLQKIRVLKSEVEELEELEKEKEKLYDLKSREMEEFKAQVENFVVECKMRVQELRNIMNGLKSSFMELQANNGYMKNSEIAAAEMRKSELLAEKENWDRNMACNYQKRAQLQKQLQNSSGSYVGLGIPLVRRSGNYFLDGSDTKSGTSSTGNWLGVSVACGTRNLDSNSGRGGATLFVSSTPSVSWYSSPLWSNVVPLKSNSPTSWVTDPVCELLALESKLPTPWLPDSGDSLTSEL